MRPSRRTTSAARFPAAVTTVPPQIQTLPTGHASPIVRMDSSPFPAIQHPGTSSAAVGYRFGPFPKRPLLPGFLRRGPPVGPFQHPGNEDEQDADGDEYRISTVMIRNETGQQRSEQRAHGGR